MVPMLFGRDPSNVLTGPDEAEEQERLVAETSGRNRVSDDPQPYPRFRR